MQGFNYLEEYSKHYNCVEIDQWFWSLFPGNKIVLPKSEVVEEYAQSVPSNFTFGIKVANSITLSHQYNKNKGADLITNPGFLSYDLMMRFIDRVAPLLRSNGRLMLQFEYLNKKKLPGGMRQFIDLLAQFVERLPKDFCYCIETRNPNFLHTNYFEALKKLQIYHVFLQGYYMPSIFELYSKQRDLITGSTVIRMHGPDRKGIEQQTGKNWSEIVAPQDEDISSLAMMLTELQSRNVESFTFVNNHFEGSAPKTIERIFNTLAAY